MSTRYERISYMIGEIDDRRYPSVERFMQRFEVSKRTIYDDIQFLRERTGLDIRFDRYRNGYYNKTPGKKLPPFDLDYGEVFALTLGKQMLEQYAGTAFEPVLRSAIEKIQQRLPEKVKLEAQEVFAAVRFHTNAVVPVSLTSFLDLTKACEERRAVTITYHAISRNETSSRKVEPMRIIENRGCWYMVAYCRMRRDMRLFALHRIQSYKVDKERFDERNGIDVDAYMAKAFQLEQGDPEQMVRIVFAPDAAKYIRERNWHPSQKRTDHTDGSCTLEFTTTSLDEVKRWVLPYGAHAEVLEPATLRKMLADEFKHGAQLYGKR